MNDVGLYTDISPFSTTSSSSNCSSVQRTQIRPASIYPLYINDCFPLAKQLWRMTYNGYGTNTILLSIDHVASKNNWTKQTNRSTFFSLLSIHMFSMSRDPCTFFPFICDTFECTLQSCFRKQLSTKRFPLWTKQKFNFSAKCRLVSKHISRILHLLWGAAVLLPNAPSHQDSRKSVVFHEVPCISFRSIFAVCKPCNAPP